MSILNKLMDTMRLTENDDDYFDEEDYEAIMMKIHCIAYGPHFDEHLAKKAVSEMKMLTVLPENIGQ